MARPREFEVEQALRDAAEVFRIRGFHATSLEDLMSGTGLAKGSLYKAFHDKKSLFLAALALYSRESRDRVAATLEAPGSPKEAIRQTLLGYIERARLAQGSSGCLLTNSAIELGAQDAEIAAQVNQSFRQRTALFEAAVVRAQAAGEVDPSRDPRSLAEFLELTVQGLRVLLKTGPEEAVLVRAIDTAVRALD